MRPVLSIAVFGAFLAGIAVGQQPTVTVDEIVAKVNNQIITRGELDRQRAALEASFRERGLISQALQEAVNTSMSDELRDEIDAMLLVQKGRELGINVDADVTRWLTRIQSEQRIADPDQFRRFIEEQSGETFEDFRQQVVNRMLSDRVKQQEVYRNINIPRAEIDQYYSDHKTEFIRQETVVLREILVSTGDNSAASVAVAERKAKSLVDRARKGETKFVDLARQYSDAPTAADGELGAFRKGDLAPEIDDVVFRNARGYITDPIRRPAGFEIYRIDEHYPAGQASEDEVEAEINARLIEPKAAPREREYLTQLRRNAFLEIKPGYVDSAAAPGKDTAWHDAITLKAETTTKEAMASHAHRKFLRVVPYGHARSRETPPAPPVQQAGEVARG